MNIIERGKAFVQFLRELASRSVWDWRRCPRCGSSFTCRYGTYLRHPWLLEGRCALRVQRHWCHPCAGTYSETSALLVRGSWYARAVHRCAIDHWQHTGSSLRRTAEWLRSWLGKQERWQIWSPLDKGAGVGERCYLTASTVQRWLDRAGREAEKTVAGQLEGIVSSQVVGSDGLWARLRGGTKRVVLLVTDSISGVIWPPVVAMGEETEAAWQALFQRAQEAGLALSRLRGVTSDGAQGLLAYLRRGLSWVQQQRCVWHLWRNLAGEMAQAVTRAAEGLTGEGAAEVRRQVRQELTALIHGVIDAVSYEAGEKALVMLQTSPWGAGIGQILNEQLDRVLVHLVGYYRGLARVTPEWCWRDFRLRLSRGRNQGSDVRLERAALVWAIYRNFTPAQWRCERKRQYRYPGQSPLQVAGASPGEVSYLDALGV